MASIDISEADFAAIAGAAITAQLSGDQPLAAALDKFARRIGAAIATDRTAVAVEWTDLPSVLEAFNQRTSADKPADNIVAFRTPTPWLR